MISYNRNEVKMQASSVESGYSNIDNTNNPAKYVRRLDKQGASNLWLLMKAQMLSLLEVGKGDSVIDVGCGAGSDVQAISQILGENGRVVGVDSSITMIQEALRRAEGLNLPTEFYVGDAENLEFPDNSFDCCRVERVLQHLHNPKQSLLEIRRIAKQGARIVVVEPDYGSIKIEGADPTITSKLIKRRCSHFRSPHIGMQLPLLYKRLELVKIAVTVTQVVNENFEDDHEKFLLSKYVEPAVTKGIVSAQECDKWIKDLKKAADEGNYRHTISLFLVSGRKPDV
jgi:ubiquinone/menaquinone biosynthesis C-methylase UbiE